MEIQNPQSVRDDRSGHDLDAWGGDKTMPVLVPKPGEPCILHIDGQCPAGCCECEKFVEEMQMMPAQSARQT